MSRLLRDIAQGMDWLAARIDRRRCRRSRERRILRHPTVQAAFADEEQRRVLDRFEGNLR
jgi:hypothetical protein